MSDRRDESRPGLVGAARAAMPELVDVRRVCEIAEMFFGVPVNVAVRFVDVLRGYALALDYVADLRVAAGGVRLPELDVQLRSGLAAEALRLRADRRDPGLALLRVVVAFLGEKDPTFVPATPPDLLEPLEPLREGPNLTELLIADREHGRASGSAADGDPVPEDD